MAKSVDPLATCEPYPSSAFPQKKAPDVFRGLRCCHLHPGTIVIVVKSINVGRTLSSRFPVPPFLLAAFLPQCRFTYRNWCQDTKGGKAAGKRDAGGESAGKKINSYKAEASSLLSIGWSFRFSSHSSPLGDGCAWLSGRNGHPHG